MPYLLKGTPIVGLLLMLCGVVHAQLPEQGPISSLFPPSALEGETTIWQLAQTADGQIIASGERVGFLANGRWTFLPEPRKPAIRCLFVDRNYLWISSLNEIGRIALPLTAQSRYEKFSFAGSEDAGDFWFVTTQGNTLVATTAQTVWFVDMATKATKTVKVASKERLFLRSFEGKTIVIGWGIPPQEAKNGEVVPFENPLPDPNDTRWMACAPGFVVTTKAVYRKDHESYKLVRAFNDPGRAYISASIWGNKVAVATVDRGLMIVDSDTGEINWVTTATSLPSFLAASTLVDRQDRLWVGTNKGLSLLESPRYGHLIATKDYPVSAIRQDGILVSYSNRTEHYRPDVAPETLGIFYSTLATKKGLALGLWRKVLVDGKTVPLSDSNTGAMAELPNGKLLVVSSSKLYAVDRVSGQAEIVPSPPQEISGLVVVGAEVWAATFDGFLFKSSTTPPFNFVAAGALPKNLHATLSRLDETLISITSEGAYFGPQSLPIDGTSGIRSARIATTADGAPWLLAQQDGDWRLGRLRQSGKTIAWETVEAKGLALLPDVHYLSAHDATLMICGGNSIIELNVDELKSAYRLAAPRLQFAFTDSKTKEPATSDTPPAEFSAENNSLRFSGTLPFDEFGEKPRFERRLLPTESTWVPTKSGETVAYPSLSARDYTLEIRTTHLGRKGPVVSHAFTVLPPWYLSTSAFGGYTLSAVILSFFTYRLRTHQIRQRNAELERIVAARTKELAEASAAKTEFLASMSHEIRNPMNGVIGLVNILREQPGLPRQANTLRLLHGCAEQLRATVDDILDFSKIEARKVGVELSTFDLLDTLEAAAATVDPAGGAITFAEKPPSGVSLRGDAAKLRQIFANYLTNALKYGIPPGAKVSTILTPAGDDQVRLTLSVTSTGPTIEKDKLDKLFESFARGEDAIERNIRGTGLGLAICKRYAEAMGGEVGAVSTNGETTFYLNVPFEKLSATASAPAESMPMPTAAGSPALAARALAIEDEDYNRIVLGDILAKMNYSVDWATTGAEALQLAQENGYDIVLTDYRLPDTNGVELTKKILQLCPDPKPAVFAVTAYSTRERRDECMNAGMSGFISKPITLEKLRTTIYSWGDRQLTKISLEASVRPVRAVRRSTEIEDGWSELKRIAATNTTAAAEQAHRLNNLCRSLHQIDIAEQLELLEGALERREPTAQLVSAIERLLRA